MIDPETQEMVRRLRLERNALSADVLNFWREHGRHWARTEASLHEITTLARIGSKTRSLSEKDAVKLVTSELKEIWNGGFQTTADFFGWGEMNDHLPDVALHAFVQGVESAWVEVSEKI